MKTYIVLAKEGCMYCINTENLMKTHNLNYEYHIHDSIQGKMLSNKYSKVIPTDYMTFPRIIELDNNGNTKFIGGFDDIFQMLSTPKVNTSKVNVPKVNSSNVRPNRLSLKKKSNKNKKNKKIRRNITKSKGKSMSKSKGKKHFNKHKKRRNMSMKKNKNKSGLIFSKKNKKRKFKIIRCPNKSKNKTQLGGFSTCNDIPTVIESGMSMGSLTIPDKVATIGKNITTGCNNKNMHPGV